MRLTAHQTGYFPWLGFWAKVASADQYCHFDAVPMESSGYENRVQIKGPQGVQWLTVPVQRGQDTLLKDVKICNDQPWQRKHWRTIELAYAKAPYFKEHAPWLSRFYRTKWDTLSDMNVCLMVDLMDVLDIKRPWVRASEYEFTGTKSALVLDMCKQLGVSTYIFGNKGKDYADVDAFARAGVSVEFQEYKHPVYPQLHGGFVLGLSVLDLIMNCGPGSRAIITGEK